MPEIFITGIGWCKEVPYNIETIKPVKTVVKAEELALSATSAALKQAGWNPPLIPPFVKGGKGVLGIIFGIDNAIDVCKAQFFKGLLEDGAIGASPLLFPFTSPNAITAQVTIAFGIKGEDITITSGPLSFFKAVEYGIELLDKRVIQSAVIGGVSENESMVMVVETSDGTENQKSRLGCIMKCNEYLSETGYNVIDSIEESFLMMNNAVNTKGFIMAQGKRQGRIAFILKS